MKKSIIICILFIHLICASSNSSVSVSLNTQTNENDESFNLLGESLETTGLSFLQARDKAEIEYQHRKKHNNDLKTAAAPPSPPKPDVNATNPKNNLLELRTPAHFEGDKFDMNAYNTVAVARSLSLEYKYFVHLFSLSLDQQGNLKPYAMGIKDGNEAHLNPLNKGVVIKTFPDDTGEAIFKVYPFFDNSGITGFEDKPTFQCAGWDSQLSHNGKIFCVRATIDDAIRIFQLDSSKSEPVFTTQGRLSIFSPDSSRVLITPSYLKICQSPCCRLYLLKYNAKNELHLELEAVFPMAACGEFSDDGTKLLFYRYGSMSLYNSYSDHTGHREWKLINEIENTEHAGLSPDGNMVWSLNKQDRQVKLHKLKKDTLRLCHTFNASYAAFTKDNKLVFMQPFQKRIFIFDPYTKKYLAQIRRIIKPDHDHSATTSSHLSTTKKSQSQASESLSLGDKMYIHGHMLRIDTGCNHFLYDLLDIDRWSYAWQAVSSTLHKGDNIEYALIEYIIGPQQPKELITKKEKQKDKAARVQRGILKKMALLTKQRVTRITEASKLFTKITSNDNSDAMKPHLNYYTVNSYNQCMQTPLSKAIRCGAYKTARAILRWNARVHTSYCHQEKAHANLSLIDEGHTPLQLAIQQHQFAIAAMIAQKMTRKSPTLNIQDKKTLELLEAKKDQFEDTPGYQRLQRYFAPKKSYCYPHAELKRHDTNLPLSMHKELSNSSKVVFKGRSFYAI